MDISRFLHNNSILMLALDHRDSFKKMISPNNPDEADRDVIVATKRKIMEPIITNVSGILIDAAYGLDAYREIDGADKPYLLAIEQSGYSQEGSDRRTTLKYSAQELKDLGAQGIKLLLYFNTNSAAVDHQLSIAQTVIQEAKSVDLPVFIEIVTYEIAEFPYNKAEEIIKTIDLFLTEELFPDVFKIDYPDSPEACTEITNKLGTTPWILLSRGVPFEEFLENYRVAKAHGCKGVLVGRALWQDLFTTENEEEFLSQTLPQRFKDLAAV